MALNFTAILTGNMGSEAQIIEREDGSLFAAFSLATTNTYKDSKDEWQEAETQWHNILVFNPKLVKSVESLKKGTRIKLEADAYYKGFDVVLAEDARVVTKKEVSFVMRTLELASLAKKTTAA